MTEFTEFSVKQYLEQAATEATPAADEHYRKLFDCFLSAVPVFLHRTGELAPSPTRPPGFTVFSRVYQFGIELGDDYASTMAVFKFRTSTGAWKLSRFACHLQITMFYTEQGTAETLPAIILCAGEMWRAHQKRLQEVQQSLPTGDSMVN